MMTRVRTIIDKEWAEAFKNRLVLTTILILPLVFTILPLAILPTVSGAGAESTDVPAGFFKSCGGLPMRDCLQYFMVNQFLLLFMVMPMTIPTVFAAYSVVGEKTTRSLEPLLATPITTEELLTAKSLAAVIPAILATWLGFAVFLVGMPLVGVTPLVFAHILSPTWLVAILVIGPEIALMAVVFSLIVSSRVNDPRAAQQISAIIIVPFLAVFFGQIAGIIVLNLQLMLGVLVGLGIVDLGLIYLSARLFQRETILTKWK